MDSVELQMLQSLPLDIKIAKSKLRIQEWVDFYGVDDCYISFSGGKDSLVMLHLIKQLDINDRIPVVFVDTGLEYPEIKQFVKKIYPNVTILRPKKSFKQVIEEYGYPVISKEQAQYIEDIRTGTEKIKLKRLEGVNGQFKLANKYRYLLDAPFKISSKCCAIMKKEPIRNYENKSRRVPFLGMMADDSLLRKNMYLKSGCNSFDSARPKSMPIGFWTEQDILQYIKNNNLELCSIYGDIVQDENGKLKTTGNNRTGCIWCMFGLQYDGEKNRFQRLKITHPELHDYCMNKLGMKEVLEFMSEPYE